MVHPAVASAMSNLGAFYTDQEIFVEAERYYRAALAVDEEVYGAKHPEVAVDLHNLGTLMRKTEKFALAMDIFEDALVRDAIMLRRIREFGKLGKFGNLGIWEIGKTS